MVVIKYVPYVADSKRAMDEYTSEIFMGGRNTIVMHNTCEVRCAACAAWLAAGVWVVWWYVVWWGGGGPGWCVLRSLEPQLPRVRSAVPTPPAVLLTIFAAAASLSSPPSVPRRTRCWRRPSSWTS